jgi:hypothetical protein
VRPAARLAVALVAAGCTGTGLTGATASGDGGGSSSCSLVLTGNLSGTLVCTPAETIWSSASDTGAFTFAVPATATEPGVQVHVTWSGEPAVGSDSSGAPDAVGQIVATNAAGQAWSAVAGGASARGSYVLTFRSVVAGVSTGSTTSYDAHGSLYASLISVAGSGASGGVVMTATF